MAAADAGLETHVRSAHIGASAMNDFDEASNYARSALDGADITIWRGVERIADHYISNSKVQNFATILMRRHLLVLATSTPEQ